MWDGTSKRSYMSRILNPSTELDKWKIWMGKMMKLGILGMIIWGAWIMGRRISVRLAIGLGFKLKICELWTGKCESFNTTVIYEVAGSWERFMFNRTAYRNRKNLNLDLIIRMRICKCFIIFKLVAYTFTYVCWLV